ncbi:ATP-binding protein [Pyrobaculum aerophilum]|uniref:ATP-binding protein n=1 Tax=Pyrobaculum aerophilum TaxID=13773 RepID=UPI002FD9B428
MNQQFINRERELAWLEELYKKPGAQLVVIYGRRRIGKTELLKNSPREKRPFNFYCERFS